MNPKISILLPTYNGGGYLAAQIASILQQTMPDFELVVVDDGSTDDTKDQLANFAQLDDRIRILPSNDNRGQKRRLLELAAAARSDLISVADQDDIWTLAKLEHLVGRIGDKAMAFGPSWIIDQDGKEAGLTILDILPPLPSDGDRLIYLFKPMVSAHAMITHRSLFSDLSLLRAHPFDWLQSLDAVFTRGIVYVPEAITHHRLHGGNQSNGPIGTLPNLWQRMAPVAHKQRQNSRYTERWMTTQRLEHLAYSPLVGTSLNATFRRAHKLCVSAWFEMDRPMALSNSQLADALFDLLAPLAGSKHDLAFTRRYTRRLSRSSWQPFDAAWHFAAAVRGPRLGRRRRATA